MLLGHKANVTSVTVLTVWVEALEEKYLPSQQHSIERLRQWPIYDSQCNPAAAFKGWPCWNSLFDDICCGINWGEVQKGGIKDKALTIRDLEAETLCSLSLLIFWHSDSLFKDIQLPVHTLSLWSDPFVRFHKNGDNGVVRLVLLTCLKGVVTLQRAALRWWFGTRTGLYEYVSLHGLYVLCCCLLCECMHV